MLSTRSQGGGNAPPAPSTASPPGCSSTAANDLSKSQSPSSNPVADIHCPWGNALGLYCSLSPPLPSPLSLQQHPHNVLPPHPAHSDHTSLPSSPLKYNLLPHPAPGPLHVLCPLPTTLSSFFLAPGLTVPFLRSHSLHRETPPSPAPPSSCV